jgi:cobalt-zinc-cadmium efflux system outer membrane protein
VQIREGVKKGLHSPGEEKLFEGERYKLIAEGKAVEVSVLSLQRDISESLGLNCLVSFREPPSSHKHEQALPSHEELIRLSRRSELSKAKRLKILYELSEERLRLAELDKFPELTPRVIYQHTNDGGDFFGAGISIPLPLWNRNQGEVLRAEAKVNELRRKKENFMDEGLDGQILLHRSLVESSQEQARLYRKHVVPSFQSALQFQEQLHRQGKGNILQVWQALQNFQDALMQAQETELQALIARTELSTLIGEEL